MRFRFWQRARGIPAKQSRSRMNLPIITVWALVCPARSVYCQNCANLFPGDKSLSGWQQTPDISIFQHEISGGNPNSLRSIFFFNSQITKRRGPSVSLEDLHSYQDHDRCRGLAFLQGTEVHSHCLPSYPTSCPGQLKIKGNFCPPKGFLGKR